MNGTVEIVTEPIVKLPDGREFTPLCKEGYELEEGPVTGNLKKFLGKTFFFIN